ncbi:peptidase T [candidate division KSB1 bacterium]|nr:peptidase T [candidate division KSB1 bacterium]
MQLPSIQHTVVKRFLNYVTYDTQSMEDTTTFPSTEKQKVLAQMLVTELKTIGLADAEMDEYGYVMATLEANTPAPIPTIGLIAHLDTSPDVSGAQVKAILHPKYQGADLIFPGAPNLKLSLAENPALQEQMGNDIITSDGTTLLGADNKAGIAEIMDAIHYLKSHPEIKHGRIRIAFTPDEEVGMGTRYFNIQKFGADYAYTIDGETRGEVENETFCADTATIVVRGVNVHPGYAKGKMLNALKIMAEIVENLPKDRLSPETTEKREGYVHPYQFQGGVEETTCKFLIRDFYVEGLKEKAAYLKTLAEKVVANYPRASVNFKIDEYYRNMRYVLDKVPKVTDYAEEAIRRSGITPIRSFIRGGTDGARLSFDGLLTPNLFTGGHNFHSKMEWISVQDMQKAVEVIIQLVLVWAEDSQKA